jgi:hypothetical protein
MKPEYAVALFLIESVHFDQGLPWSYRQVRTRRGAGDGTSPETNPT